MQSKDSETLMISNSKNYQIKWAVLSSESIPEHWDFPYSVLFPHSQNNKINHKAPKSSPKYKSPYLSSEMILLSLWDGFREPVENHLVLNTPAKWPKYIA